MLHSENRLCQGKINQNRSTLTIGLNFNGISILIYLQPEKLNVYKNEPDTSWDYTLSTGEILPSAFTFFTTFSKLVVKRCTNTSTLEHPHSCPPNTHTHTHAFIPPTNHIHAHTEKPRITGELIAFCVQKKKKLGKSWKSWSMPTCALLFRTLWLCNCVC